MINFSKLNEVYDFLSQSTIKGKIVPFSYKGTEYNYTLVSDLEIPTLDIQLLTSCDRKQTSIARVLKLFFSPKIASIEIQCLSTFFSPFCLVINFVENGIIKTIDYSTNVIMDKPAYYDLFQAKVLNTLTKSDLYKIYKLLESENCDLKNFLLLTHDEIDECLDKEMSLELLRRKYDPDGINMKNYYLFEDAIFFLKQDYVIYKEKVKDEIETFTSDEDIPCEHIMYSQETGKYRYSSNFMEYEFSLISDIIPYKGFKELLLSSENRYCLCHTNSILLAKVLTTLGIKSIYIVAGARKINESDLMYHTWLEIDGMVYDFNGNLIMKKDDYYELYQAVAIEKTSFEKISETEYMCEKLKFFQQNPWFINYFCDEVSKDLKKNKFMFKF